MDTPTSTDTPSTSSSHSFSEGLNAMLTFLSPKDYTRSRANSNATFLSSRSVTPVVSRAPSTIDLPGFLLVQDDQIAPQKSPEERTQITILDFTPQIVEQIVDHLEARDILHLSHATRRLTHLRASETFRRHLMLNGWDTDALVRRTEMAKDYKGSPWLFLARSAIQKDDILTRYALLPTVGEKKSLLKDRQTPVAVKKFLRILMDVVTEHDQHNFSKLTSLANALQLSLIQWVTAIQAHDWEARYCKTFIVAAYTNSQPLYPECHNDVEKLSETLCFEDSRPPLLLLASRANLLYTYACMSDPEASPPVLQSRDYDEPHLTSRGTTLPGLRQAVERFTGRVATRGFYRKANGDTSSMEMNFDAVGLDTKSRLPFSDKHLTLEALVSGGEHKAWQMSGSISRKTGVGKLKTNSGLVYDIWVTPWGVTGQKIRAEGKRLGVFVLHWT
ncbi:hypothetical protein JB92DRAFT_1950277 [Gautieria morchelliformis]|nr:hypothetical protein JB92DRAFT_1950277 [Gautieria morchelliformis]